MAIVVSPAPNIAGIRFAAVAGCRRFFAARPIPQPRAGLASLPRLPQLDSHRLRRPAADTAAAAVDMDAAADKDSGSATAVDTPADPAAGIAGTAGAEGTAHAWDSAGRNSHRPLDRPARHHGYCGRARVERSAARPG